jgi:hypothetical protein
MDHHNNLTEEEEEEARINNHHHLSQHQHQHQHQQPMMVWYIGQHRLRSYSASLLIVYQQFIDVVPNENYGGL